MDIIIKEDSNCIMQAFENNTITIIKEEPNTYLFKAIDISSILGIVNIRTTIMNFDDDERVVRKHYDTTNRLQDTLFLTSRGVYRLLYNSKKEIAKKFRKWVGDILDDINFNNSQELIKQVENHKLELENINKLMIENDQTNYKQKEELLLNTFHEKHVFYLIQVTDELIKYGKTMDIKRRFSEHKSEINKDIKLFYIIESNKYEELEKQVEKHKLIYQNVVSETFNGKIQTEIVKLDERLTLKDLVNTVIKINKTLLNSELQIQLELEREKTKQREIELEMKKVELEIKKIEQQVPSKKYINPDTIKKIKAILQLDINGIVIKEFNCAREAANEIGGDRRYISGICHKNKSNIYKNSRWRYK